MTIEATGPSAPSMSGEIRHELIRFREKSAVLAFALFALDAAAYTAGFLALLLLRWPWEFKIPLSILLGVIITRLFIVGHDAAHGSLTGYRLADNVIARLAFLPSLHPCSLWQVGHNRVHHSFTNLKGIDFIWMPFSPEEYRELSPRRRRAERFYRSIPGMGAYYMVEIWWKYLSVKGVRALGRSRRIYWFDLALTLAFLLLQAMAACFLIPAGHSQTVFLAVVLPFLVWNWLIGFIIYNHHTSISVRFYNNRKQWRFYEGQIRGTVHMVFPRPINMLLNRIMEHTAHHLDVSIPFYRLAAAQDRIEQRLGEDLIVERWSLRSFVSTLRVCQLYNYDQQRWVTFADATEGTFND
jgi:omega-6 fatty acid desaturase (delta-12 desaturase)